MTQERHYARSLASAFFDYTGLAASLTLATAMHWGGGDLAANLWQQHAQGEYAQLEMRLKEHISPRSVHRLRTDAPLTDDQFGIALMAAGAAGTLYFSSRRIRSGITQEVKDILARYHERLRESTRKAYERMEMQNNFDAQKKAA